MRTGLPALLLLLSMLGFSSPASGQQKGKRCTGEVPDSTLLGSGPVYRDCEVDQAARLRVPDFPVDYIPPPNNMGGTRCLRAEFQFVVDSAGHPDPASIRPARSNDRGLEEAVRPTLERLRYQPARLGNRPVRQLVVYARSVASIVRVSPDEERTGLPQVRSSPDCR